MDQELPTLPYARREQREHFSYRRLILPLIAGLLTAGISLAFFGIHPIIALWVALGMVPGVGVAIGRSTPRRLHVVACCAAYAVAVGIAVFAIGLIASRFDRISGGMVLLAAQLCALAATPGVFVVSLFGAYLGAPRRSSAKLTSAEPDSNEP